MRGKKAKKLRNMALDMCTKNGHPPGNRDYGQVKNCHAWAPSGQKDENGDPLLMHVLNPGTIYHNNKFMIFYKALKKIFKRGKKV